MSSVSPVATASRRVPAYRPSGRSSGPGFSGLPAELARVRLPVATYAVFAHREHVSTIRSTWLAIWSSWLPGSGLEAVDAPSFERYPETFDPETGNGGFEIWIPVRRGKERPDSGA